MPPAFGVETPFSIIAVLECLTDEKQMLTSFAQLSSIGFRNDPVGRMQLAENWYAITTEAFHKQTAQSWIRDDSSDGMTSE